MAATDMLRGRQTATRVLTNKSGASVAAGDIVVIGDGATDKAFTTNTTARQTAKAIGVAMETIANNAAGLVATSGYVPKIVTSGAVTREHYLYTHTVAKQATAASQRSRGAFGQVLNSATSPEAILWGKVDDTHEFDYVEITSNVSVTGNEGAPTTVVTGNSVTYDGTTPVVIEFFSPTVIPAASASAALRFYLKRDSTVTARIAEVLTPSATAERVPVMARRRLTPSAGAHTYTIVASTTTGTATVGANTGADDPASYHPAYIRITKV